MRGQPTAKEPEVRLRAVGSSLRVAATVEGAWAIVEVEGRLTVAENTDALSQTVERLLKLGVVELALDLEGVSLLDCSGLGQLVLLHARISKAGGSLRLARVAKHQKLLLEKLSLLRFFEVPGTERQEEVSRTPAYGAPAASGKWPAGQPTRLSGLRFAPGLP